MWGYLIVWMIRVIIVVKKIYSFKKSNSKITFWKMQLEMGI